MQDSVTPPTDIRLADIRLADIRLADIRLATANSVVDTGYAVD